MKKIDSLVKTTGIQFVSLTNRYIRNLFFLNII